MTVAKTALWIAESQMMKETEDVVHMPLDFLPLKSYANIVEGNALRLGLGERGAQGSVELYHWVIRRLWDKHLEIKSKRKRLKRCLRIIQRRESWIMLLHGINLRRLICKEHK